ncbi:hypothetical protein HOC80_00450 [archaeon]|jgi:hypothetical protein|nr:hypothetical protein [archaeon]MBT4416555.1 hypothetical protein [archaeon]
MDSTEYLEWGQHSRFSFDGDELAVRVLTPINFLKAWNSLGIRDENLTRNPVYRSLGSTVCESMATDFVERGKISSEYSLTAQNHDEYMPELLAALRSRTTKA